ncbi:MAG TPA: hypothetical protein VMT42_03675 [candidate division Zixibacteria bacterium]|nr:hypothetical protein [candidate division Zixibacteria bacterium]
MMRSVEVFIVIMMMTGAFLTASFFAVLPSPRKVSPLNLSRLSLTTLETLDAGSDLGIVAFDTTNDTAWNQLQVALSASLPPNIVYNLTAYDISSANGQPLYSASRSISNTQSLGIGSDAATYMVASSNVTFSITPQKIAATLYILNCSDSNGWWITGYTVQSIAQQFADMFASYFDPSSIVMVQNTSQLGQLLNGGRLGNENPQNAIVINTCGEAVPIPTSYAIQYQSDYAQYCYQLGKKVNQYNWTWASIVGYPFYYVTNTGQLPLNQTQNTWGIYGMRNVDYSDDTGRAGLNAFLEGIDNQQYSYSTAGLTSGNDVVSLTPSALNNCSYYGIFPSPNQTVTRALSPSIITAYNLTKGVNILNTLSTGALSGRVFNHIFKGDSNVTGSLFTLGITRVPDTRLATLGILCNYNPVLYRSQYTAAGTSKLVVLQLGLAGGS